MPRALTILCCLVSMSAMARAPKVKLSVAEPALRAPEICASPGEAYADDTRVFQGVPTIERAANGRLWAAWFAGKAEDAPDNYVVLVTSDTDGEAWSPPKLVIDPASTVRAFDPCLWHDPSGRLWLFWAQTEGKWDGRGGVWCIVSDDSQTPAPTWSQPRRLCDGVMLNKPTALRNGDWLLPVSLWAKPATDDVPTDHAHDLSSDSGAQVYVTRDAGQTFALIGQLQVPEREYDEHQLIEHDDDSLWMLVRTTHGIAESESTDQGKTWTESQASSAHGINSRFHIRRLRSGRLLLITHAPPNGKSRSHLVAQLSDDEGRTWCAGLMLDERKGVSYPDAIEDAHGVIRVIYDFERTKAKQVLLASFIEEDVLRGEPSHTTHLRMLVNPAPSKSSPE